MSKIIFAAFIGGALLPGCTNQSGATMGLFSATAPVIAILADDLFLGEAEGYASGSGTITIQSKVNADIRYIGQFRYTAGLSGSGQMQCNDGSVAIFQFQGLSMLSGYGFGSSLRGPVSFTYGLTLEEAEKYLKLPQGKVIRRTEKGMNLVP
ncbi:MAG: hypothetical protein U1E51_24775, partial [Candidatus Binatia bacterium]|nr:hypothetical protein [Candidatus Binatia bacterium]